MLAGAGLYDAITGGTFLVGAIVKDGMIRRLREAMDIIRKTLRNLMIPTVT